MKAQVTEIKFNVMFKNKYKVAELHSLTEQGKTRKDIIFNNSDVYPSVKGLKVGDTIDIKMKKNGDFWNVVGVEKLSSDDVSSNNASSGNGKPYGGFSPDRDIAITRMSVLKTSTDFVTTCLTQGLYKKTTNPDILMDEIYKYAQAFEQYVQGKKQVAELESSMDSLEEEDDMLFDEDDDD